MSKRTWVAVVMWAAIFITGLAGAATYCVPCEVNSCSKAATKHVRCQCGGKHHFCADHWRQINGGR